RRSTVRNGPSVPVAPPSRAAPPNGGAALHPPGTAPTAALSAPRHPWGRAARCRALHARAPRVNRGACAFRPDRYPGVLDRRQRSRRRRRYQGATAVTDTHSSTQDGPGADAATRRRRPGRPGRAAWTGALALAVTGGVLVSASASAPLPRVDDAPEPATGGLGTVAVGAPHHDVTAGQMRAVLDRAEAVLRRRPNPG